jgi:hypothetical protein
MPCIADDIFEEARQTVHTISDGKKTDPVRWNNTLRQRRSYDVNAFIGYEMKLVSQVEQVFISKEDDEGKLLRVTIVVDERDAEVRAQIYRREQAVMDELKNLDFNFHILAREGRPLQSLITDEGAGENAL